MEEERIPENRLGCWGIGGWIKAMLEKIYHLF